MDDSGGGIGLAIGGRSASGATGTTTVVNAASATAVFVTLALKPITAFYSAGTDGSGVLESGGASMSRLAPVSDAASAQDSVSALNYAQSAGGESCMPVSLGTASSIRLASTLDPSAIVASESAVSLVNVGTGDGSSAIASQSGAAARISLSTESSAVAESVPVIVSRVADTIEPSLATDSHRGFFIVNTGGEGSCRSDECIRCTADYICGAQESQATDHWHGCYVSGEVLYFGPIVPASITDETVSASMTSSVIQSKYKSWKGISDV